MCVADQFIKSILPIDDDRIDRAFAGKRTKFSQWTIIPQYHFYICLKIAKYSQDESKIL